MKAILDFLRKIGILRVYSGDYTTSEYDSGSKEDTDQEPVQEETPIEEAAEEAAPEMQEEPQQ